MLRGVRTHSAGSDVLSAAGIGLTAAMSFLRSGYCGLPAGVRRRKARSRVRRIMYNLVRGVAAAEYSVRAGAEGRLHCRRPTGDTGMAPANRQEQVGFRGSFGLTFTLKTARSS